MHEGLRDQPAEETIDGAAGATPAPEGGPLSPGKPLNGRHTALTVLVALAVVAALYLARDPLIPIAIAIVTSYALEPIVARLTEWHVSRAIAAALVVATVIALMGTTAWRLKDEAVEAVRQLPEVTARARQAVFGSAREPNGTIAQLQRLTRELDIEGAGARTPPGRRDIVPVEIVERPIRLRDYVWWTSRGAVAFGTQLTLILFLVFFMLASGDQYKRKLVRISGPSLSDKRITVQILDAINTQIEFFLLHLLLSGAIVGVATWIAFWWLGVRNPGLWGFIAGVLNSIPYVGPAVVLVGSATVALVQFGTIGMALLVGGVSLVITGVEGFLLTPMRIGRAARMNPVAVFVGLLFWGWLWGAWGVLLAVPLMMAIKVVADHVDDLKPVSELLGD